MATNGDLKRWYGNLPPQYINDFVRVGINGKIDRRLLPNDYDDIVEGYFHDSKFYAVRTGSGTIADPYVYSNEIAGETGKLYYDKEGSILYIWTGSSFNPLITGFTIQANSDTTLPDGWSVPNLSVDQVTQAYNALVAGMHCSIQTAAGDETYVPTMVNIETGDPCITIMHYWLGWIDYQVNGNTVTITPHKISEPSSHQITSVTIGTDTIDIVVS